MVANLPDPASGAMGDPRPGDDATGKDLPTLDLVAGPRPVVVWMREVWAHRRVLAMLSRADFHVRYKRASLGIAWAVALPLLQAAVLAVVFAKVLRVGSGRAFAAYVLAGVLAWGYFSSVTATGSTAIVEGAGLTDKVWFPRALLPLVPVLSNLAGLGVSMVALLVSLPILGVRLRPQLLLLVPACMLLIAWATALALGLSALHVYFRDVRFLVQAALLVWFYLTPIAYPRHLLGSLEPVLDANPMTGIVTIFHMATVGSDGPWLRAVVVSVVATVLVLAAAVEGHRRHDRLFVDLL